ncbi:MAG: 1-acyl-sn-glycerol-3-phosphate acyltransferase [Bifidobacteriaceae bacterium]|jgi:1-acyl-sn-glycerol-3-phosphate acyltransferase|nr:1-acyl-sn-glycerol-3-phosphate acyltransferase [Bifidobacteriaceae bacterium]
MYWFLKILLTPVAFFYFRPFAEGVGNIPRKGACIAASNHVAAIDSLIFPLLAPRKIYFMGKDAYFTAPGVKGRIAAWFFRSVGVFPVDRAGGSASDSALQTSLKILREGHVFGLYPEGTRSQDGRLYKAHTGVARIALQAKVPIIPVAMIDTNKAQKIGQTMPKPISCGAKIGKPIKLDAYYGKEVTHEMLREISDNVMREIQKLSEQEYVDEYAVKNNTNWGKKK